MTDLTKPVQWTRGGQHFVGLPVTAMYPDGSTDHVEEAGNVLVMQAITLWHEWVRREDLSNYEVTE